MQKENVDKIIRTINDSVPVVEDVDKALADGKISWIEAGGLVIHHGGKAINLITAGREILNEIADLDPEEAKEVMNKIAEAYGGENELAVEGAKDIVVGLAGVRTGVVKIIESKKQEERPEPAG